ncbi:MAG: DUF2177 family protein [Vicinamibacterales bacterium]
MPRPLAAFLTVLVTMLVLDGLWLTVVAKRFYEQHLGYLLAPQVQWWAAILFYFLYVTGVVVFVVLPRTADGHVGRAFLMGALFGLVCYATYDLTSQALIRNWPVVVTVVDMAWGAVLTGTIAAIAVRVSRSLTQ